MRPVTVELADADAGAGGRAMLRFLGVGAPPAPGLTVAVWRSGPATPGLARTDGSPPSIISGRRVPKRRVRTSSWWSGREIVDNIADFLVVEINFRNRACAGR